MPWHLRPAARCAADRPWAGATSAQLSVWNASRRARNPSTLNSPFGRAALAASRLLVSHRRYRAIRAHQGVIDTFSPSVDVFNGQLRHKHESLGAFRAVAMHGIVNPARHPPDLGTGSRQAPINSMEQQSRLCGESQFVGGQPLPRAAVFREVSRSLISRVPESLTVWPYLHIEVFAKRRAVLASTNRQLAPPKRYKVQ